MDGHDALAFFGIDGSTGEYLVSAEPEDVARLALSEEVGPSLFEDIRARLELRRPGLGVADVVEDVTDLSQTGWGVIFGSDVTPAVREALRELLDLRRGQATRRNARFYQEYAHYPGETKQDFLRRLRVPPSGAANPAEMPYYLLIVSDPESVSYSFQYQLDVQYAVGRIFFETPEEYANYAHSVVLSETSTGPRRSVTFFGVQNPDDLATSLSASRLIGPLAAKIHATQNAREPDLRWSVDTFVGADAGKKRLGSLFGGSQTPGLLFTASHGLAFPAGDRRQREDQGALVCQDWPGPKQWHAALPADFYFGADDIDDNASPHGLIAFHFACYGAGTPQLDDYPQLRDGAASGRFGPLGLQLARSIAPHAFLARLPQRLLGHPKGGALAVVGHVERALGSSFLSDGARAEPVLGVFEDLVGRITRGLPVGYALEPFNERYAELCSDLTNELREVEQSAKRPSPIELARMWTGSADARGYVILGDPAVRLAAVKTVSQAREEAIVDIGEVSNRSEVLAGAASEQARVDTPGSPPLISSTLAAGLRIDIDSRTGRISISTNGATGELKGGGSSVLDGDVSFGLFGGPDGGALAELRTNASEAMKSAATQLAHALSNIVSDVTTVEVTTYTSDDVDQTEFDSTSRRFVGGARRRAVSRVQLDGSVSAVVPQLDGKIDQDLWAVHCQLVERALSQRMELLKALASAASGFAFPLKGL